jgi:tRNA(Ile)-lysidine synthetase-like protein
VTLHPDSCIDDALRRAAREALLPPDAGVLLAVSGGADSLALLHACAEAAAELQWRLAVGHVHHGWRGRESDRDLAFVADHARRLGLPFLSRLRDARGEARRDGTSPEAGARSVRYAALHEMAREAGASRIATAHQKEDRIESWLLARARRGGISALAGPREVRDDGIVRPFLAVSREEILAYLRGRGLAWRRDASNGDLRLARNRVRREIAAASGQTRAAWEEESVRAAARRDSLDREFAEKGAPALRRGPGSTLVDARALAGLDPELIRRAIEQASLPFARSGRPPMTGREREQILRRIEAGGDFRFEAGRRIAVSRTGGILTFSRRPRASEADPVYDFRYGPSGHITPWKTCALSRATRRSGSPPA